MPSEGMSMLDMGFTRDSCRPTQLSEDADIETEEEGGPSSSPTPMAQAIAILASRAMQPSLRQATTTPFPIAIAKTDTQQGQQFWRVLTRNVDTIIKANCTAQVIPSAQLVAEDVIR